MQHFLASSLYLPTYHTIPPVTIYIFLIFYVHDLDSTKTWRSWKRGFIFILFTAAAAAAKSLQSCPTLCDPTDGSPPGSPTPGILQARTLEWIPISLSKAWKWKMKVKSLSRIRLLATPWTAAYKAPPPWDFPGKSTGVGCHCLLHFVHY